MLVGITLKLPGWRLANTGANLCWNHSSYCSGPNSRNLGARVVKAMFKMMSRTAGFLMNVMFLCKIKGFKFNSSTFDISEIIVEMRVGWMTHLYILVCLGQYSSPQQWRFSQEAYQKSIILSHTSALFRFENNKRISPGQDFNVWFARQFHGKIWQALT